MNAANALSYVTHRVAIPFVRGLLNNQIAAQYLTVGLGRIGDSEASEVLIHALDLSGNSGRVAGFARMARH